VDELGARSDVVADGVGHPARVVTGGWTNLLRLNSPMAQTR
jgi:hypothetical protein